MAVRFFYRIIFFLFLATASTAHAWDAEIYVDGQAIPAEIIAGYQVHNSIAEHNCPPLSDIRDRDKLVAAWVRVKVAEEKNMLINEKDTARIAELEKEVTGDRAKTDTSHKNKYQWLILSNKAHYYWRTTIGEVTAQDIKAEYDRLLKDEDPRFVNAPFFRRVEMQSHNEQTLQTLADRLRAGETWRQVNIDVDPYDWNSGNMDQWIAFDGLENFDSKAFHALKLDGHQLLRNDVIGPLAEHGRYRLVVILDKTIVPVVPLNATLWNSKKWAAGEIRSDLYQQRHKALNATLLEKVEVTQNGEQVSIALKHERCSD